MQHSKSIKTLYDALRERILVLDGAMGTMIQRHALEENDYRNEALEQHPQLLKGNNDLLSITRPSLIQDIHASYLSAGADIIETNTFCSTSIAQADYGLSSWVPQLNYESARLAKEVALTFSKKTPNKPRWVAGSLGPTNRTASLSPDVNDPSYRAVTFDILKDSYKQQVEALIKGGVDLLLIETIFDTLNAKAALMAITEIEIAQKRKIPTMISGTITDASGRTLSGQVTEAFLISVAHFDSLSIGFNCALGAQQLSPYIKILAEKTKQPTSVHPNAGLPNEFGKYDETPEETASYLETYVEKGWVNIVGGCCGTTPDHIQAIATMAQKYSPRELK